MVGSKISNQKMLDRKIVTKKLGNYHFLQRPYHPKLQAKMRKTIKLLREGADPDSYDAADVLDPRTLYILNERPERFRKHTLARPNLPRRGVLGEKRALVLLVDFNDKPAKTESHHFRELLFSENSQTNGSLRDYYREVSWGQLDVTGEVSEWYRSKEDLSYYADNMSGKGFYPKNSQKLVEDLVKTVEKNGDFEFPSYDNNGDGVIEMLVVIHAGEGAERTGSTMDIASHQSMTHDPVNIGGVKVVNYCILPELPPYDLGGFCHEFGHLLGLPDLYDMSRVSPGIGDWCLMGLGSWNNDGKTPAHLSAWCKVELGWTVPTNVTGSPKKMKIPEVYDGSRSIYRLWTNGLKGNEYFLIENRRKKGFDKYIPGEGLLIWHVDETSIYNSYPNSYPTNFRVALEQADGERQLEKAKDDGGNKGDPGDVFPGELNIRTFDSNSNPSSLAYDGSESCITITSISDPGDEMTALIGVSCGGVKIESLKESKAETIECMDVYKSGYKSGYCDGFMEGLDQKKL
ncbi:Immune inhibitor A peptidase M6 [anaerobic digester metagenome]